MIDDFIEKIAIIKHVQKPRVMKNPWTIDNSIRSCKKFADEGAGGCIDCDNEHYQLANWLTELQQYRRGQYVQTNKKDYIPLKEAINHTNEVKRHWQSQKHKDAFAIDSLNQHTQLEKWLTELQNYRNTK